METLKEIIQDQIDAYAKMVKDNGYKADALEEQAKYLKDVNRGYIIKIEELSDKLKNL